MTLLDVFRQEYVKGKVIDKYKLANGNVSLVVEDSATRRRYHVEFRDNHREPSAENLYGLLNEPFARKSEPLDRLIGKDDVVELTMSYSRGPFREAYQVHSVSGPQPQKATYRGRPKLIDLPYKQCRMQSY